MDAKNLSDSGKIHLTQEHIAKIRLDSTLDEGPTNVSSEFCFAGRNSCGYTLFDTMLPVDGLMKCARANGARIVCNIKVKQTLSSVCAALQ